MLRYVYCCSLGVAPQDGECFALQNLNTRCLWYVPTRIIEKVLSIEDYHRDISTRWGVITANILFQNLL